MRIRFGLRTLLLLTAIVAVMSATLLPALIEMTRIAQMSGAGIQIYTEPRGQFLFRQIAGDAFSERVVYVHLVEECPMPWLEPVTLRGSHATLEPLTPAHCDALAQAVDDGEIWRLWYTNVPKPEEMEAEIARRLDLHAKSSMLPFAVLDASHTAVGMTTFMHIDAANKRVEIGATWYAERVQRSALNTECKLMLMTHAFETLGCIAVEFRTSYFNYKSRRAIERLGAKLDGILRNHQHHRDGSLRDTCVYSIIQCEWPTVQSHLRFQMERAASE